MTRGALRTEAPTPEHIEDQITLLDRLIPMARTVLRDAQAKVDRMERKRDELIAQKGK